MPDDDQPAHRTHVNEFSGAPAPGSGKGWSVRFVAWCRCEWVSPMFGTFAEADRAAVEHLNEGRKSHA